MQSVGMLLYGQTATSLNINIQLSNFIESFGFRFKRSFIIITVCSVLHYRPRARELWLKITLERNRFQSSSSFYCLHVAKLNYWRKANRRAFSGYLTRRKATKPNARHDTLTIKLCVADNNNTALVRIHRKCSARDTSAFVVHTFNLNVNLKLIVWLEIW